MISDKLFEAALQYKNAKPWKVLLDSNLFAVRFSDGVVGYCSTMGNLGTYNALAVYPGEEAFESLRQIMYPDDFMVDQKKAALEQECLQCCFDNKSDLMPQELEAAQDYARRNGIVYRGKMAFPHFLRFQPYHLPWMLQGEREQEYLILALRSAVEIAQQLSAGGKTLEELGFEGQIHSERQIPLLEWTEKGCVWSKTKLPAPREKQFPKPRLENDLTVQRLKQMKKSGTWACELVYLMNPVENSNGGAPYYPLLLLAVNSVNGQIIPPQMAENGQEAHLLEQFAEELLSSGICPYKMQVRADRTEKTLETFCKQVGIKLNPCRELPILDEIEADLSDFLDSGEEADQLNDLISMLMELDAGDLKSMPPALQKDLKALANDGMLPAPLVKKLNRAFGWDKAAGASRKASRSRKRSKLSYVISVSLGTGCYRHIRISGDELLDGLHLAIQQAFGFENDHAYAFFMDNRMWSDMDAYYADFAAEDPWDGEQRTTSKYRLKQLKLEAGKKFKYIFDFGDEWQFQCKVLKVLEEETSEPVVVRSKGEAPSQYGDEDDWEDE